MEENKELDKKIRSSFEKINQGAPDSLWSKLSAAMDSEGSTAAENAAGRDELDEKIRGSFNGLDKKAPWHVWPAINRQLNIEKVWQGISGELDKTTFHWPVRRMAAALLLLLLSATGTYFYFQDKNTSPSIAMGGTEKAGIQQFSTAGLAIEKEDTSIPAPASEDLSRSPKASGISAVQSSVPDKASPNADTAGLYQPSDNQPSPVKRHEQEENKGSSVNENELVRSPLLRTSPALEASGSSKPIKNRNDFAANSGSALNTTSLTVADNSPTTGSDILKSILFDVQPKSFIYEDVKAKLSFNVLPLDTLSQEEVLAAALPEEEYMAKEDRSEPIRSAGINAGPVLSYNSSWLLNNETRSSYDKNSLISTDPTYKENWGLALNIPLFEKSAIATELYTVSKAGQQYRMYQEGEYLRKGLELRYFKLYLQYQQNFLYYGKSLSNCLTAKVGGYGGFLQKKLGEIRQEENSYSKLDYGLKGALGQENSFGPFILGYGISAERGLNNVFEGSEKLPAEFNKTYILNIGTYLNLRYIIQ